MALLNAIEGATHTGQSITWTADDGTAKNLTGATLSGTIRNVRTGVERAITGTLALVTAASGIFTWAYASADIVTAAAYQVQFKADYGSSLVDYSHWIDWTVEPGPSSAGLPRSTMTHLVARVRGFCANNARLTDLDIQGFLDDRSVSVNGVLEPQRPFYTVHVAPFENLETNAQVFYGFKSLLIENTDYTSDYQRGLFTTPQADYRGLRIVGTAYDIHAAAADGWEQIAGTKAEVFDWSDVEGKYSPTQARDYALTMAQKHRRKAWATGRTVERADTPELPRDGGGWKGDLLRRERAGYT